VLPDPPRKKRKSYDIEGHAHGLTFSCYRRRRFFDDDEIKRRFLEALEKARKKHGFLVWAYVIMPEHIHLLVFPRDCLVRDMLKSIKGPMARSIIAQLKRTDHPDLKWMRTGNAKRPYAFWQAGGGYDRNLHKVKTIWKKIEYIHLNPVRRKLVESATDWKWSSARFYFDLEPVEFAADRCGERDF
jgi:putative transposase